MIHFFNMDGRKVRDVPRMIYPEGEGMGNFLAPPHYKKNGIWKFFVSGMDTLFRVEDMRLVPEVVFEGESYLDPNVHDGEETRGKAVVLAITEGENYWMFLRMIYRAGTEAFAAPLTLINKETLGVTNLKLTDDLLHLFNELITLQNLTWPEGQKPFQDGQMYLTMDAVDVVEMLKNRSEDVSPEFQTELDKLENLKEDDNPVIFLFTFKDSIILE